MKNLIILIAVLFTTNLFAQKTGRVDYKTLGISFTIPDGWVGQETEASFIMGSNTVAGFILLIPNGITSMSAMEMEARKGISEENGTFLQLDGELEKINNNTIGGEYKGLIEWSKCKAFMIGKVNPFGNGVTVLAATTSQLYSAEYKKLAKQVAASIQFSKPVLPEVSKQWSETLKNARLTYMNTVSSYDGGFSDKIVIDLCAQGYFRHSSNSSMAFDTDAGFGSSHANDKGAGTWKVTANAAGQAVLQLNFNDGSISEYVITLEDGKTFLNGTRYFRTYGNTRNDGPDCF